MEEKESQKGIALYISLIIMAILLAIGLGLTVIIVGQTKIIRDVGDSVIAFHAADTGIEQALYNRRKLSITTAISTMPVGAATYSVEHGEVVGVSEYWRSVGVYKGENRAIRIDQFGTFDFLFTADDNVFDTCFGIGRIFPEPTILHVVLISGDASGADKHIYFSIRDAPGYDNVSLGLISATFNPTDGDLSLGPLDPVNFELIVNSGTPAGMQFFEIVAASVAKTEVISAMVFVDVRPGQPCPL